MPEALTAISNTSPLLYLHRIGQIQVLRRLYGLVCATTQVVAELAAGGLDVPGIDAVGWLEIRDVRIPETLRLVPDLGAGEASSIALALEIGSSSLLLLDDRLGRRIAGLAGLSITGTAGILVRAKQKGLVPAVRPLLEELLRAGFHLRADHVSDICRLAGE